MEKIIKGGYRMLEEIGLKRIRLDLPFRLNHVNCFLAEGPNGWIVIDAGLHNKPTVKRWEEELQGKEVSDIYITHYHPDHFGYAGGLQQKTGAKVSMSKIDATDGFMAWEKNFLDSLETNYQLSGIPKDTAKAMADDTKSFKPRVTPYPEVNHFFQEGEKVQIGKLEYEIYFTPGHSDGLIVFFNKEKSVLLSTDHILPKITPNISYWYHGDPNPLQTYYHSLEKVKKLNAEYVIPSHREPFTDANKRIEEIKAHHAERLEKTLEAIQKESTVYQVSKVLFPFIETIHETRFAVGETLAHLEYLRSKGECKRELVNGKYVYFV